jgi:hypothetical protein
MDANEYLLGYLVRDQLETRRAAAERAAMVAATRRPRGARGWRATLGHALTRLGRALASEPVRRTRHA